MSEAKPTEVAPGEPVAWLVRHKTNGAIELAEPYEVATNPTYWTDAFPVYDRAAVLAERERCAKLCDTLARKFCEAEDVYDKRPAEWGASECAAAIRKGE